MYTSVSPIGAGDRPPDFSLPDKSGALINLYTTINGGTPLVIFYSDAASFSDEAAPIDKALERAPAGAFDVFAVVRAPTDSLPDNASGSMSVIADPAGQTVKAYGIADNARTLALRFDANLRLTALRATGAEAVKPVRSCSQRSKRAPALKRGLQPAPQF